MTERPRLVLGSGSPRRRDLLAQIGIVPQDIRAADINEDPRPGERPLAYVTRLARQKSEALDLGAGEVLLTADTTVCVGLRILGKPTGPEEAAAFLRLMSGRRHKVITAIAMRSTDRLAERQVTTSLRMAHLSDDQIAAYVESGEWKGKAGGYAIQGAAGAFIPWLSGSFTGVVGLPLTETSALLRSFGILEPAR